MKSFSIILRTGYLFYDFVQKVQRMKAFVWKWRDEASVNETRLIFWICLSLSSGQLLSSFCGWNGWRRFFLTRFWKKNLTEHWWWKRTESSSLLSNQTVLCRMDYAKVIHCMFPEITAKNIFFFSRWNFTMQWFINNSGKRRLFGGHCHKDAGRKRSAVSLNILWKIRFSQEAPVKELHQYLIRQEAPPCTLRTVPFIQRRGEMLSAERWNRTYNG